MSDLCVTPSSTYFLDCPQLGVGCTAALSLEFNRIDLAPVESDHVRHARAHAKPFQPCCFNRAAIAPICRDRAGLKVPSVPEGALAF